MPFREPAPDGSRGSDNLPLLVLTAGALLKGVYTVKYLTAGGMSVLYTASRDGEQFLIKEVEAADSRNVLALTQEKSILERLNHPGIVKVYDIFEQDGFYYMVLDYIEGQSMEKLISPLPDVFIQEKVILGWALQLCDIFEYLHRQTPPIIYRDLKPRNLVKDTGGRVHLVDFGIARIYKQGRSKDTEAMGSALTASPEHYGGSQTDERSDIFTIGATLHFFITNGKGVGEEPFQFAPVRSINPRISENLEHVIKKCLELDPKKRYQSVREMRQALLNSREVPLPVTEPFGESRSGAGQQPGSVMDMAEGPGQDSAIRKILSPAYLAAAIICVLVLLGGMFIVNRVFDSGRKSSPHQAGGSPVAYVSAASSLPAGAQASVPAALPSDGPSSEEPAGAASPVYIVSPTTAASADTGSRTETSSARPSAESSASPSAPASYAAATQAPGSPAVPHREPSPPALSPGHGGAYNRSTRTPEDRNPNRRQQLAAMARNFSYADTADPSSLPVIRSAADPGASDASMARLYRDDSNGYQIVLQKGWTFDSRLLNIESRQDSNVVGAFSHNLPNLQYPVTAIIVRITGAGPDLNNPQACLERWISADQGTPRISHMISPAPAKESAGGYERVVSDMTMNLRGHEVLQTRMVYMDQAKGRAALIKCYFRANDIENARTVKQLESPVVDSFGFTGR